MGKINENLTSEQPDMFQRLSDSLPDYLAKNAPDLDIEQELLGAIKFCRRMAKRHGLVKVEQIVDRMNLCLPESLHITPRQLNGWCSESGEYRLFPAIYLPAFIWATRGILKPLEVLTDALGLAVMDEQEQLAARLGNVVVAKTAAAKEERLIKQRMGG